jgi:hypothetical protein
MRKTVLVMVAGAFAMATQAQADTGQGLVGAARTESPPTTIVFPDKGPSGTTDLPMGAHRIPETNVIISGHQKGGALGAVFGVFGMLAQSAANADAGKGAVGTVQDRLRFDVASKAAEMTAAILAGGAYKRKFTLMPDAGGGTLSVVPYVTITFVNEGEVRPYVVLKTTLSAGASGESARMIKYFCCEGPALPLAGLTDNGGERLKAMLTFELETAIHVMLLDRSQTWPRDKRPAVRADASLPFVGKPIKVKGYELGRHKDYSLFEIRGGNVFAGVHAAEPGSWQIRGASAK